jgi:hypothetical protein
VPSAPPCYPDLTDFSEWVHLGPTGSDPDSIDIAASTADAAVTCAEVAAALAETSESSSSSDESSSSSDSDCDDSAFVPFQWTAGTRICLKSVATDTFLCSNDKHVLATHPEAATPGTVFQIVASRQPGVWKLCCTDTDSYLRVGRKGRTDASGKGGPCTDCELIATDTPATFGLRFVRADRALAVIDTATVESLPTPIALEAVAARDPCLLFEAVPASAF